jgi:LmbE family N-acetylglucosaminyl deacetylase
VSSRRLLISVAHPDDESFGLGGVVARYVDEGAEVYLICATNGDVGTVAPEMLDGYSSIAELRLAELNCASQVLGFKRVYTFGYRDSGMVNSETSTAPECLWQAPQEEVTRRVVEVIREVKPHVVLTFNRYGGYGHPDHIAIQRATAEAFNLAADSAYVTPGHAPYRPQKLYYGAILRLMQQYRILRVRLRGEDPRHLGKNKDIDVLAVLENDEPHHALIDVGSYLAKWEEASNCHTSQLGGFSARVPYWVRRYVAQRIPFTRVYPVPAQNRIDEHDLFAGVTLDESVRVS